MTGKRDEIQGRMNLVRDSVEFELSGFYFREMYGVQSGESVYILDSELKIPNTINVTVSRKS